MSLDPAHRVRFERVPRPPAAAEASVTKPSGHLPRALRGIHQPRVTNLVRNYT